MNPFRKLSSPVICGDDIKLRRRGLRRIAFHNTTPLDKLLEALERPGEMLKESKKSAVQRIGHGVVLKQDRQGVLSGLLRHTFRRQRYRRAWLAAHHLLAHGVCVPAPLAFIEWGFLGIVWRNAMASQYLEGFRDVEKFLVALTQANAGKDEIERFLNGLAGAVNTLNACGAYHADLSGKNIFTRDGERFYFIDLDSVDLDRAYTEELRLLNHVQLYDSFCDFLNDAMLVLFITRMLTPEQDPRRWVPAVREGQRLRRLRTEKAWERQGRLQP